MRTARIKINGYSVKELSELYKIPTQTIYYWYYVDPDTTFKKVTKRITKDLAKTSERAKANLANIITEESNKTFLLNRSKLVRHEEKEKKLDSIVVWSFVFLALLLMYIAW